MAVVIVVTAGICAVGRRESSAGDRRGFTAERRVVVWGDASIGWRGHDRRIRQHFLSRGGAGGGGEDDSNGEELHFERWFKVDPEFCLILKMA